MAERKRLVIDANILIRACLGVRARALIADFASEVDFYVAEANAAEASGYIGELASHRGLDPQICQEALLSLMEVVQMVDTPLIEAAQDEALKRIRDPADWPALAQAWPPGLRQRCSATSIAEASTTQCLLTRQGLQLGNHAPIHPTKTRFRRPAPGRLAGGGFTDGEPCGGLTHLLGVDQPLNHSGSSS